MKINFWKANRIVESVMRWHQISIERKATKAERQLKAFLINKMDRNGRKRIFCHVRPTKSQISRAVWSESSLSLWRNIASSAIQNAPSEDSDQPANSRRLIWIFAGRMYLKVHFRTFRFQCNLLLRIWLMHDDIKLQIPINSTILSIVQLPDHFLRYRNNSNKLLR